MLNDVKLMGRLTADPELRRTQNNTAVTSFTLAVERDGKPKDGGGKIVDYLDCVAWEQTAEFAAKYFSKGRMAVVSGKLQTRTWEDRNSNRRKAVEVKVENMYFGDSKPDSGHNGSNFDPYGQTGFGIPMAGEDLPF